jgi:hypothetical protein
LVFSLSAWLLACNRRRYDLQLAQVFTTCLCYTSLYYWGDLSNAPDINVASDTQDDRDSSQSWLVMGIVATGFMAFTCCVGWWYQRLIHKRFILTVEDIYRCGDDENISGTEMDTMEPSDDHAADVPPLSVMGDGPPLEEEDHKDSAFDASTPLRVLAPTSAANTFYIMRKPVGVVNPKIEILGSE